MERIKESGLEIFKGEELIIVKGKWSNEEVFYNFIDGLLKKDYTIISMELQRLTGTSKRADEGDYSFWGIPICVLLAPKS